jgi:hypothetical protein
MPQAAQLLSEVLEFRILEEAFLWAIRQEPRIEPSDVVIQDEYSHDALFRAIDGSFLVFDTT